MGRPCLGARSIPRHSVCIHLPSECEYQPIIFKDATNIPEMFSILNEIADNSHFRTTSVIFASIGGACSLYILTGITGYLSYGDNIRGNIVSMYPTAASTLR